jgi:broad specificity phosphatase PhoE
VSQKGGGLNVMRKFYTKQETSALPKLFFYALTMIQISRVPFYFLRHGQTQWNKDHKAMGSQDIPLNDEGISQALSAQRVVKSEPIATIVSSPLLRARKTAQILQEAVSVPIVEVPELKEVCWGEKEGQPFSDFLCWVSAWKGGAHIKHGEPYDDFLARVKLGLNKALHHQGPVLIVSHGGVYCAIQDILGFAASDLDHCELVFHCPPAHSGHPWRVTLCQ